jgi:2-dehydro-3-deoxyphosphooctonate aldolase (KDO 8-P synthase)
VIESEKHTLRMAREIEAICVEAGVAFVFKASFDKANRTSISSWRGPGLEDGLRILGRVKNEIAAPVLSDVHCVTQVERSAAVLDILQIPAFLCRQTDLLVEAGKTGKPVNIKKGQFLAPRDIEHAIDKVRSTGNEDILVTERGTTFGYGNLVVDFRSLPIMRAFGCPVIFDATHSVQAPSAAGGKSGGDRHFAPFLARAACAVGIDALFLEVHDAPDQALSDGPNSLPLTWLPRLLDELKEIDQMTKRLGQ